MKNIPIGVALENRQHQKTYIWFCRQEPNSYGNPLVGEYLHDNGKWYGTEQPKDSSEIIGLWADREPSRQEKLDMFIAWLDGTKVRCRYRNREVDQWRPVKLPRWDWRHFVYEISERPNQ